MSFLCFNRHSPRGQGRNNPGDCDGQTGFRIEHRCNRGGGTGRHARANSGTNGWGHHANRGHRGGGQGNNRCGYRQSTGGFSPTVHDE